MEKALGNVGDAMIIYKNDSMAIIQNKLKNNRIITFEKGVILKITKQLILYSNTSIDLNGAILQRHGNIQSVFITQCNKNTTKYNGAYNITIKNGTIENMGAFYPDNLIQIIHAKNILIDNIAFKDGAMHDIEINGSCDVKVINCLFSGHYSKAKDDTYKETIQYDMCTYSGFVLQGTKPTDKMYDGTCCNNILIENCTFQPGYRGGINCCIGQHCQGLSVYHENFTIRNNTMIGDKNKPTAIAIRIIGIKNAVIDNNKISSFARGVLVENKDYSYNNIGSKVNAKSTDGLCDNVLIQNNNITSLKTYVANGVYVTSRTTGSHRNIKQINNKVV